MAPVAKRRDFLDRHDNHARRLRALETGAHPLPVDVRFAASYPVTILELTSEAEGDGWVNYVNEGTENAYARVEKRMGVVQLRGAVNGPLHTVPAQSFNLIFPEGGLHVLTLPEPCWPPVQQTFPAAINVAPMYTRLLVTPDGKVVVLNTPGLSSSTPGGHVVYLDNATWIAATL